MALPVVHRCLCRVGVLIGVVEGVVECATRLMSVVITRNFSGEPPSYCVLTIVYVWQLSTSQGKCRQFRSHLRAANPNSRCPSHYHPVCRGGSGGFDSLFGDNDRTPSEQLGRPE